MAELEAADANTKHWLQMQITGRIEGKSCGKQKNTSHGDLKIVFVF